MPRIEFPVANELALSNMTWLKRYVVPGIRNAESPAGGQLLGCISYPWVLYRAVL